MFNPATKALIKVWSLVFFLYWDAHIFFFGFCSEACAELVIGPRSRLNGNLAFSFPGLAATRLASLCDFAARLYLLRTGAGSRSAAAFTARRYGWEALWLLARSPKFSSFFFSRGPHLRQPHILCHMAPVPRRVWSILRRAENTPACHPTLCLLLSHNEMKNSFTHNPLLRDVRAR